MPPVVLPPFVVNAAPFRPSLGFGISEPDEFNTDGMEISPNVFDFDTNIFQGGLGGGSQDGIVTLPPFVVTADRIVTPELQLWTPFGRITEETEEIVTDEVGGGATPYMGTPFYVSPEGTGGTEQSATPYIGTPFYVSPEGTGGTEQSPTPYVGTPFYVSTDRITTPVVSFDTPDIFQPTPPVVEPSPTPYVGTPFYVSTDRFTTPSVSISTPTPDFTTPSLSVEFSSPVFTPTPSTPTPVEPSPTTPSPTPTPIFGGGGPSTVTTTSTGTSPQRDFEAELGKTLAALARYQPQMLGMYKDLYQSFMPQGLTAAEASGLAQMRADEEKLNRLRQGILSPEDIRTATQGAREAYGARGQVFAPGAIGAEILNREAIRQQREDQARAAYQQSMGNVLNVANLQTGNIFEPIGNLLSSSFNPLGAYPADVYGTNVNAALAREIAQKNYEAAIESARLSGQAQSSAARTSAGGSLAGAALPFAIKGVGALFSIPIPSCMPGTQCIDTPKGPKQIKDLKGGDIVIGYDGNEAFIVQACNWNQDPTRTFLTITREDGTAFTVCDDHKILGIPAMEWAEGADMAGSRIASITASNGLLTSYDILTNQGGYRIAGVPVNSMIPEIMKQAAQYYQQFDFNSKPVSS